MHCLCHVGWVMLCSLPPAMPSQFESLSRRPANGGCWSQHGQSIQTTWGRPDCDAENLTVISFCPPAPVFFALYGCMYACVHVCVCVLPAGLKSQHQTATHQSLWAGEKKTLPRCSAPKGQHNVTFDLFLSAHKKETAKISGLFKMGSADNGWHFWSATFHRWLWMWKDIDMTKGGGWIQVTTQNNIPLHYLFRVKYIFSYHISK